MPVQVYLRAMDAHTLQVITEQAKSVQDIQPLYVTKLVKACAAMGCRDEVFYEVRVLCDSPALLVYRSLKSFAC